MVNTDFAHSFLRHCPGDKKTLPACSNNTNECEVLRHVERWNKSQTDSKVHFFFCPKCKGFHFGWDEVEIGHGKKKGQIIERPSFEGGIIQTAGTTERSHKYTFAFACDCICGSERSKAKIATYKFNGEDRNWCFYQRVYVGLMRSREFQNQAIERDFYDNNIKTIHQTQRQV